MIETRIQQLEQLNSNLRRDLQIAHTKLGLTSLADQAGEMTRKEAGHTDEIASLRAQVERLTHQHSSSVASCAVMESKIHKAFMWVSSCRCSTSEAKRTVMDLFSEDSIKPNPGQPLLDALAEAVKALESCDRYFGVSCAHQVSIEVSACLHTLRLFIQPKPVSKEGGE